MDSLKGVTPRTEPILQPSQFPENGFPRKGRPRRQKELFKNGRMLEMDSPKRDADRKNSSNKIIILNMDPPKGRPRRQKQIFKQVRIVNMDSPKGETPQTERTLQQNQDSEHGFPKVETLQTDKDSSKKSRFSKWIPPKGRPHKQKELISIFIYIYIYILS